LPEGNRFGARAAAGGVGLGLSAGWNLANVGAIADETIIRLALARTFAHRRRIVEKLLAGGNA